MNLLSRRVAAYLDELVPPRHPRLAELEVEARRTGFPIIGPATGHLCYLLTRLSNARHVFELGSGFGYSTAWFARAVKENGGGIVHHVVWDDRLSRQARENLAVLGLADVVQFHVGEAVATLQQAPGPFRRHLQRYRQAGLPEGARCHHDQAATRWAAAGRQHAVEWAHLRAARHEPCDPRRARVDAADSGRPAVDCVRDPRARRPAGCAARRGAIRVVGYLEHPREGVITMNCPACGTAMTEVAVSDVKIQACKGGCGGLWFDEWTLRKVDQPDQSAGEALLHIEQNAAVKLDPEKRRNCPRDAGIVMMRHFWSVKRDVVVDECPKCEGIFLDPGELAEIRSDYKSDGDRHKAAQAYYREMFDTQLAGMLREDKAKLESARKVANIFKFICPSYYIPGKQAWGAF